MIPAKSRERKCSTCKHYQPSPLWRKGWCRNPLLYDRNTNHLVEAESLSCNRTFIDYWEPGDEAIAAGAQGRSPKPRIAPSIPMDTYNASGERLPTGHTPAVGIPAALGRGAADKARPPLSIVTPDYEELDEFDQNVDSSKATRQMPEVQRPGPSRFTARDRIRAARTARPGTGAALPSGSLVWVALAALALLLLVGGAYLLTRGDGENVAGVGQVPSETATATAVPPTPTGFGDPTPTAGQGTAVPTSAATEVAGLAVGRWAQVSGSGAGLVVRAGPSRTERRITAIPERTKVRIIDGPE